VKTTTMTRVAMFVALMVGSGWALAMVPNVEFITALAFTAGAALGPLRGAVVGSSGMFLFSATNPLGSGLAFPVLLAAQMISQGLTGLSGGWFQRWTTDVRNGWPLRLGLALTGLALTVVYDGLTTISFPLFAGASRQEIGVVLISGLAFTVIHQVSNLLIFLWVVPRMIQVAGPIPLSSTSADQAPLPEKEES
jgi:uncharacterized membrane protein